MGKIHSTFKFIHSNLFDQVVHKCRQMPMLGSAVPELHALIQKSLRTYQGNGHNRSKQRYTPLFPSPLRLLFPRHLLSATVRDIPKGNSQPPEICGSQISLDLSDVFAFNTPHGLGLVFWVFFSFHELI